MVKSIVSTELAGHLRHFGVALYDTLTGFKFIGERIQRFEDTGEHTFLFGFEESYGYLSSTFVRDKDGVNASMLIAEAAAYYGAQGKTLWDVMEEIFQTFGFYLEYVDSTTLPGIDGLKVMGEIMARIRQDPPREIGGEGEPDPGLYGGHGNGHGHGPGPPDEYPEATCCTLPWRAGICMRAAQRHGAQIKLYVNVTPGLRTRPGAAGAARAEAEKLLGPRAEGNNRGERFDHPHWTRPPPAPAQGGP